MILRKSPPEFHLNHSTLARSGQSSYDHWKPTRLNCQSNQQSYSSNRARGSRAKQKIGEIITAESVKVEGGISGNIM